MVLPSNALLANLSTRGQVGSGEKVLIAGFVVAGKVPQPVLIRAVGPTLTAFGVPGVVADPMLELPLPRTTPCQAAGVMLDSRRHERLLPGR